MKGNSGPTSSGAKKNFMAARTSSHIKLVVATIKYIGYHTRGCGEFAFNLGMVNWGQTYSMYDIHLFFFPWSPLLQVLSESCNRGFCFWGHVPISTAVLLRDFCCPFFGACCRTHLANFAHLGVRRLFPIRQPVTWQWPSQVHSRHPHTKGDVGCAWFGRNPLGGQIVGTTTTIVKLTVSRWAHQRTVCHDI